MPGINGMLVFLLALAVQVCVSGLRPFWAGLILPALYEGLIWVTMAGYAQVYGRWQPEPLRVFLEASVPAAALLVVWLGIRCWSGRRHSGSVWWPWTIPLTAGNSRCCPPAGWRSGPGAF